MRESGVHDAVARAAAHRAAAPSHRSSPASPHAAPPSAPEPRSRRLPHIPAPIRSLKSLAYDNIRQSPRQRPSTPTMAMVMHHNPIADPLHIHPRSRRAKGPQTDRNPEDAIDMRPDRNNRPHRIVERQGRRAAGNIGSRHAPRATRQTHCAQSSKRSRVLQKERRSILHLLQRKRCGAHIALFKWRE